MDALTTQRKFGFVDGLSRLFIGAAAGAAPSPRGQAHVFLESPRFADVAGTLHAAVDQAGQSGGKKVVLVLDQPDAWLAAAGTGDGVTSGSLRELVLDLREVSCLVEACFMREAVVPPLLFSGEFTFANVRARLTDITESSRYDSNGLCRRAPGFITNYDFGEGTCRTRPFTGARGRGGPQHAVVGHWHGEGCEWSCENHPWRRRAGAGDRRT